MHLVEEVDAEDQVSAEFVARNAPDRAGQAAHPGRLVRGLPQLRSQHGQDAVRGVVPAVLRLSQRGGPGRDLPRIASLHQTLKSLRTPCVKT
jgi:hypothetical protein